MNQYSAIREVRRLLRAVMEQSQRPELIEQLEEIDVRLKAFHDRGIDFKEVVDGLDDSIMITDAEGTVLYINPAYTRNTEITEEDVLNRDVRSLIGKDKLFTGGAVTSVLESGKSAFRLSTTYKTGEPLVGYVVGTPIFKEDGSLRQVVACSRPIVTLSSLQEDFEAFVKEINAIHPKTITTDSDKHLSEGMIGKYGSLKQIDTLLDRVAPTDASVLITGESGVGKEVVADEIYRRSLRKNKPYVKINCASIPGHLLESELFGYEKGAFTGASKEGKMGVFESADKGTVFLDEVGDLPLEMQVHLLRVLQEMQVRRVGGVRSISVDVRIIAATNRNLLDMVHEKTFREDLYYRLNVVPIEIPPLRERKRDIRPLVESFLKDMNKKYRYQKRFADAAMEILYSYVWPGNVRELKNVVEQAVILSAGDEIQPSELPIACRFEGESHGGDETGRVNLKLEVARFEYEYICRAYEKYGTVRAAAASLGMDSATFVRKRRKFEELLQK